MRVGGIVKPLNVDSVGTVGSRGSIPLPTTNQLNINVMYEIRISNGLTLEVELDSMFLTPEMVEDIISDNASEYVFEDWALYEKSNNGEWFLKFESE